MAPRQDLTVYQGETWSFVYTHLSGGSPVNLTGYSARMMVKAAYADGFIAYLTTGPDANGGSIALGGVAGTITLSMTDAQSAALGSSIYCVPVGDDPTLFFRYDLEIVSPAGAVTKVLEGRFLTRREVTR